MMSEDNKELDQKDQDTKDTDLENKNSDESEEEEFDFEDEDEDEDSDEEDEDNKSSEDDDKPVTKKELRDILKGNQNKNNANRRISQKNKTISKSPVQNERLDKIEANQKRLDLLEAKRQFGHENNLSPKEVDYVFRITKRPTAKVLNDPFIKSGLAGLRSADNVRKNTPGSSPASVKFQGKDWKELKPEERQASFADRRKAILESKKR
jgi:hypothetical protein